MIIDSHHHFWRLERGDYCWLTKRLKPIFRDFMPEDLAPLLETADVGGTILVQAAPTEAETAFLLDIAQRTPFVMGVIGWTDFDASEAPGRIAALAKSRPLVGLRPMIHNIADPDWMLSPAVGSALRAMREAELVFDALVRPPHLSRLTVLADRHPGLAIVIDHCAKPLIRDRSMEPWASDMTALAQRPNVSVKLSGLATEAAPGWTPKDLAPYVRNVLKVFGPDRVLWGSDWPVLNLAGGYASWIKFSAAMLRSLPSAKRAAVMGGNARRIYLSGRGKG